MWELDHKEGWALKNWCFWIVVLEKTLKTPLDSKEIKPIHPKGNQSWIFIGRTDVEAPTLWPLMQRTDSLEKTLSWERLRAGGKGGNRRWDGWMASSTQWTWVLADSRRQWSIGKPGVLSSMGSQRVRYNLVIAQQFCDLSLATMLALTWVSVRPYTGLLLKGSKRMQEQRKSS